MEGMLTTGTDADARPPKAADHKRAVAEMLAEMGRLDERIRRSQAETDHLRLDTREILERLRVA